MQQSKANKCLLETTSSAQSLQEHQGRSLQKDPREMVQTDSRTEARKTDLTGAAPVRPYPAPVRVIYTKSASLSRTSASLSRTSATDLQRECEQACGDVLLLELD